MSDVLNTAEFNQMFSAALSGGQEALEKTGEAVGLYIQDKLRENSFFRKILPPQTVTESELVRNVDDEGLSYIDDLEPDSIAMRVNWRGEPNKTYIQGKRYAINLSTISSERFQKSEQELRSYKMPLTKVIEQNTVKDMQEQVDLTAMMHVKAGIYLATMARHNDLIDRGVIPAPGTIGSNDGDLIVDAGSTRNFANEAEFLSYLLTHSKRLAARTNEGGAIDISEFNAANTARPANQHLYSNIILSSETEFNRNVLRDLIKVQSSRQMKARCFLLHESDWNDTVAWTETDAGLEITSEIVKDGYKYTTVAGYTFVTTVRDNPDIISPGQIFAFPSPEFLGRYLILENTKFFIEKKGRFISMEAWEDCGIGFGNIKGLSVILLAGASIDLPCVFQDSTGALSGAGANGNEDGYSVDTGVDALGGRVVRVVNDISDASTDNVPMSGGTVHTQD